MRIEIEKILDGSYLWAELWVCDLRFHNYSQKPIRHVKPQLVVVRSNEETNITTYYSDYHFAIKSKDGYKKAIIKVFDNTGFRAYTGVALAVFDNEIECKEFYQQQVKECREGFALYLQELQKDFDKLLK